MDPVALLKAAERAQLPPVVLVHGADSQLPEDALAAATRGLLPDPSAAVFDREVFDGQGAEPEAIVNAAMTMPVMGVARLVAVRRCEGLPAKAADLFARYVAKPNPTACLLLLATGSLAASRDQKAHWLLGVVPAASTVVTIQRKGRALTDWVRQRAETEGIAVSEDAVRLLVQFVGEDGLALLGEVRKAALAGAPERTERPAEPTVRPAARAVGVREVTAVVGEHRVAERYDLLREIERGNTGAALRTLDRLLVTEEAPRVLALLAQDARSAWMVKVWRARGQSVDQIAGLTRKPRFAVEATAKAVDGLSRDVLVRRLERCWEVEQRLKSGGEPRAELGVLVADLCGTGRSAGTG